MYALVAQHQLGTTNEHLEKCKKSYIDDELEPPRRSANKLTITETTSKIDPSKQSQLEKLGTFPESEFCSTTRSYEDWTVYTPSYRARRNQKLLFFGKTLFIGAKSLSSSEFVCTARFLGLFF
jgi:hypothetical protein